MRHQNLRKLSALAVVGGLLSSCSHNSSGPGASITGSSDKIFCSAQSSPNLYMRLDLSSPIAHIRWVRMIKENEAPIVYETPDSADAAWTTKRDATSARNYDDGRIYANVADTEREKNWIAKRWSENLREKNWLGTGISHPAATATGYALIVNGLHIGALLGFSYILEMTGTCESFDKGLLKTGGPTQSFDELQRYREETWENKKTDGLALTKVLLPRLPITQLPLKLEDLTRQSWCGLAGSNESPVQQIKVHTFANGELLYDEYPLSNKKRERWQRHVFQVDNDLWKNLYFLDGRRQEGENYFHAKDADGREYLIETTHASVVKGNLLVPDKEFRIFSSNRLVPCNDSRIYSVRPESQAVFEQARASQLEELKTPPQ